MGHVFGKLLRKKRTEAGRTMGQLARHLGVTVPYISAVEHGEKKPLTHDRIIQTAAYLEIDAQLLFAAAAQDGRAFELVGRTPIEREVGAALARSWTDLSEDQLRRIQGVVSGGGEVSEDDE